MIMTHSDMCTTGFAASAFGMAPSKYCSASKYANARNFVTVAGTNFQPGSSVYLNGDGFNQYAIASNFVSSTQLNFTLFFGNILSGTFSVEVADPAPGGFSNLVFFTVTGPPDFSFTVAAGQGSQTVSAGQTATFANVISVNALNGFAGSVSATCSLPAQAVTCSVMPSTLTAGQSANVVVTTTARSLAVPPLSNRQMISWPRAIPIFLLILLCFLFVRLARTRRQRIVASVPLAGVLLFLVLQAVGCGGGSSYTAPPPPQTGTLAGTYMITVTGMSSSSNTSHTATLQLTVN
jgi:hypothetical protein